MMAAESATVRTTLRASLRLCAVLTTAPACSKAWAVSKAMSGSSSTMRIRRPKSFESLHVFQRSWQRAHAAPVSPRARQTCRPEREARVFAALNDIRGQELQLNARVGRIRVENEQHMPKFFFHSRRGSSVEVDRLGVDFANLQDAVADARRARHEVMAEEDLDQLSIEIADQSGRVLAVVPSAL